MKNKGLYKLFSLITSGALLLNSLIYPFAVAYAQEATPTPSPEVIETLTPGPTSTPSDELTATPFPSEEPIVSPTPSEEPIVTPTPTSSPEGFDTTTGDVSEPSAQLSPTPEAEVEKVCLTDEVIVDSKNEDWNTNEIEGYAETQGKVVLGTKYVFPLENKVTLTFKCLPKDESLRTSLKIQKIKVSDLELPEGTNPYGEYAYDITTGMNNGDFEYELTLPKPDNTPVEVSYLEDKGGELKAVGEDKTKQEENIVKVESLDHLSIWIVSASMSVSGSFSGVHQVTVNPSTDIEVSLEVGLNSNSWWMSSSYRIGSDSWICVDTSDHQDNIYGSAYFTENFSISAPVSEGTYNLDLRVYTNNSCTGSSYSSTSLTNGIIVENSVLIPTLHYDPNDDYALTSVSGVWTSVSGGSSVSGVNTDEVRWGNSTGYGQSGLKFDNSGQQSFSEGDSFYLGALTHFNWPIYNAANGATLKITLRFSKPEISSDPDFSYDFQIEETPNGGGCPVWQQSSTPCDDKITFPSSYGEKSFQIGDKLYTLKILGFVNSYPGGTPVSQFITEEQKNNTAFLVGTLSSVLVEAPQISLVEKAVNGDDADTAPGVLVGIGDTVNFTYSVQNTGNVQMTDIAVTDSKGLTVTCPKTTLESGESMICSVSSTAVSGQYTNTAHVTGKHNGTTYTSNNESANYYGVGKITICHASNSQTNPYITNEPNRTADVGGHDGHNGPIWYPGISVAWGDIIPSFTYPGGTYAGKNWDLYGQSVWNNGCQIPQGTLTVNKVVPGNDNTQFNITGTGTPTTLGSGTFLDGNTGTISRNHPVTFSVAPGTYNITETVPTGWVLVSNTCTNVVIANGENKECTITNTLEKGHLIVQKTTFPTEDSTIFTINASGTGTITDGGSGTISDTSDKDYEVTPGTYSVTENTLPGWGMTNNGCTGIQIDAGETEYCTIVNKKLPVLTVEKVLVGESIPYTNFSFIVDDGASFPFEADGSNNIYVVPGQAYTITESNPGSGYNVTYSSGCTGNLTYEQSAICTITNTKYGSLTVVKNANPDSSQNFNFVTSGTGLSDFSLDDDTDATLSNTKTFSSLLPGSYSVTENSESGWDLVNAVCSDGSNNTSINISAGENVTCTFNNVMRGAIGGYKYNDADGSIATTGDRTGVAGWTIELYQNDVLKASTTTALNGSYGFGNLVPGEYKLKEGLKTGWFVLYPTDDFLTVVLDPGENDFNNNFINVESASVTFFKNVDIDGDGDVDITDSRLWTWDIDGEGNYGMGSVISRFMPGTFVFSEDQKDEYHVTSLVCNNGVDGADNNYGAVESQSITISSGQNLVCTFTNTRNTGTLRIEKSLTNNNGGTLDKEDFSFKVNNGSDIFFESDGINEITVPVGTYTVVENPVIGYSTTYNNCTDVMVTSSGTTCTITNDDVAPSLTLDKVIINDNGGNAFESDWTLEADGGLLGTLQGTGAVGNIDVQSGSSFKAGIYSLNESSSISGYNSSLWSCVKNGGSAVEGSTIELGVGDIAVCTITNNDNAPTLRIVKEIVNDNGGNLTVEDFDIKLDGTELSFDEGIISGNTVTYTSILTTVESNKEYNLTENNLSGYEEGNWNCVNYMTGAPVSYPVTLEEGQDVICTITNDDIQPLLTVTKIVSGGDKVVSDFPLFVDGIRVTSGVQTGFNAGTYTVNETNQTGYTSEITGNCSSDGVITLAVGDVKSCTITNTRDTGTLKVKKNVDLNGDGDYDDLNERNNNTWKWQYNGSSDQNTGASAITVSTGNYVLTETMKNDFHFVNLTCNGGVLTGNTVTVNKGANVVCTFRNARDMGTITIVKDAINNDVESFRFTTNIPGVGGDFYLNDDGIGSNSRSFTLPTGSYWVEEDTKTNWKLTDLTCEGDDNSSISSDHKVTIDLDRNENVTCKYSNTELAKLWGFKYNDKNANGHWNLLQGEFGLGNFRIFLDEGNGIYDGNEQNRLTSDFILNRGYYEFTNLLPGTYSICEELQSEWSNTTSLCQTVVLTPGDIDHFIDFGNVKYSSISGSKYEDINASGSRDTVGDTLNTEPGLQGWTIQLKSGDGSQILDSVVTDSKGDYEFLNLIARNYQICEVMQTGWINTTPLCYSINLSAGENKLIDFGNIQYGSISGMKYIDVLGDGNYDSGQDWGGSNWTINLYKFNGSTYDLLTSTTTDSNGNYSFNDLEQGTYKLEEVQQFGYQATNPSTEIYEGIVVNPGDDLTGYDFGNFQLGGVQGCKYNDVDGNGQRDDYEIEYQLSGWTMKLYKNNDGVWQYITETQTGSGEDKRYYFNNVLGLGTYYICEEMQPGWIQTEPGADYVQNQSPNSQSEGGYCREINNSYSGGGWYGERFGNMEVNLGLTLAKSNSLTGNIVDYTLTIENTSNQTLNTVKVTDALPGGFTYVTGSTKLDGVDFDNPTILNGTLVWEIDDFEIGTKTLTYKVEISSDVIPGTYTNLAYATGNFAVFAVEAILPTYSDSVDTEIVSSDVALSSSLSYGGSLTPQVLGASTELPATGNPTVILLVAVLIGLTGTGLKIYKRKGKHAKN